MIAYKLNPLLKLDSQEKVRLALAIMCASHADLFFDASKTVEHDEELASNLGD